MGEVHPNFIAGEWRAGTAAIENRNPSDLDDVIGLYAQGSPADVEDAVAAARAAVPRCRALGIEARADMLDAIGRELLARTDELGHLLSREEGKPLAEARSEVGRAGRFFTYYAAEALRIPGETTDSVRPGVEIDVRREPVGVVAVVTPWNFPMATAAWKIAPALAFGNAVIWKPANLTPACAWALAEIVSRAGFPEGAFQLVMGGGTEVGERLVGDPRVDAVSFTGSLAVGRRVATLAAPHFTRIQLELGSKNALVVMDDADLDLAVEAAIHGAYSGTGQKCTASSRLVVHERVHDAFVERLASRVRALRVGHALDDDTEIGPLASETQLATSLAWIERARREGARLVAGGEALQLCTRGWYMSPALLVDTTNDMSFNREELFGPIASVIRVGSYEEALAVANDTEYGLVAGIVTRSLARASHFRRHAEAGCVMVNLPTAGTDYHVPFGGRKNSSYGPREQGRHAVEFYTEIKTSYIRAGSPE